MSKRRGGRGKLRSHRFSPPSLSCLAAQAGQSLSPYLGKALLLFFFLSLSRPTLPSPLPAFALFPPPSIATAASIDLRFSSLPSSLLSICFPRSLIYIPLFLPPLPSPSTILGGRQFRFQRFLAFPSCGQAFPLSAPRFLFSCALFRRNALSSQNRGGFSQFAAGPVFSCGVVLDKKLAGWIFHFSTHLSQSQIAAFDL